MICERCQTEMEPEEARDFAGRNLCEDCYMDALSPAKTCDPWATYTASRLDHQELNPTQQAVLELVARQGGATAGELMRATGKSWPELERDVAALRHMERMRAAKTADGGKVFKLFRDN